MIFHNLKVLFVFAVAFGIAAPAAAQQSAEPYWQYVATEPGVNPYSAGSCVPDQMTGGEGAVQITVNYICDQRPAPQTKYLLEWSAPPRILAVSKPFDIKIKATVVANAVPTWTLGGAMGAVFQAYTAAPGIGMQSGGISVGPSGNPHVAGETFTWDNLARPAAEQLKAPPAWWGNDARYAHPSGQIRFNFKAMASSQFWWSYVYKLVEPKPRVTAAVSGASFRPGIAPGAWVTILGDLLSEKTRLWAGGDFIGDRLPASLDGVRVTIDGKAAYIYYISPGQLNVLAPDDIGTGQVRVVVTNSLGTSEAFTAAGQRFAPALFAFGVDGGKHVIAHNSDGNYLAKAGIVAGLNTRPVIPGEIITLYGSGFGPTNPPTPADRVPAAAAPTAQNVVVTIGGWMEADVLWAGKIGPGLYQINVQIPEGSMGGERTITATVGLTTSPEGTVITIR
jgi:uncharacterized protein (TIGR03437 family)